MTGISLKSQQKRAAWMRENPKVGAWTLLEDFDCEHAICRCECGAIKSVKWSALRSSSGSRRCVACTNKERHWNSVARKFTKAEKRVLAMMYSLQGRCNNPAHPCWKNYGAKGVEFKFESAQDALHYVFHTSGAMPFPGATITRVDTTKGFERGNMKWATRAEHLLSMRSAD